MKTVVYDRWLHSMGGGEVVACSIAKILKDEGHEVLFISGKQVPPEKIMDKLKIDLRGVKFVQIWNDETAIKKVTRGKDLFINISFMDYTIGFAKKNIYYVNFPTQLYDSAKGLIINRFILPIISYFIKPVEALTKIDAPVVIQNIPAYALRAANKYAVTNLTPGKVRQIVFKLYLESFYKSVLESFKVSIDNANILEQTVKVNHISNSLVFTVKFIPSTETVYLNLNISNLEKAEKEFGKIYIYYPIIFLSKMQNFLLQDFFQKLNIRLRAGIYSNVSKRLSTYRDIVTYSAFAWKWIKKYWDREAIIIAPPVDLLYKKYKIESYKKKNWICSVGRFFTLGHGKKQEIMIEAFKKIYDEGYKNWELHLVGGLGDEPTSIEFFKFLKESSKRYPIFFHINVSAKEVEEVYLNSKIYWHATGFGEDSGLHPIRFEHFGISPIEAMSAKCIPVLFDGGGLPEIIKATGLDPEKHLFKSIPDLAQKTINIINEKPRIDWNKTFSIMEENYSFSAFKKKFLKLIV